MAEDGTSDWQSKPTIRERCKFLFNNDLMSDVKFVVTELGGGESESSVRKVIPAHKFVLAVSSPVFFAMFYGKMSETKDTIDLPDCEYESVVELFRFLYSDEVNLNANNVMQVMYLAKKYTVPSLVEKCAEYLQENMDATNVFCVLPFAEKFEEKDLVGECWKVIDLQAGEALMSSEFVTVERSTVESIVKRDTLNMKEVDLFKAVDRWATYEAEKRGLTSDGKMKRQLLGEEIVNAVRFPLMTMQEFASVVPYCNILTKKDLGEMMKYFSGVSHSLTRFSRSPRVGSEIKQICYRFAEHSYPISAWSYSSGKHSIRFVVNKPINFHGIRCYGCESGKYTTDFEVKPMTNNSTMVTKSGSYCSKEVDDYYGFDVLFDRPVKLEPGTSYLLDALIKGPISWYGKNGKTVVECSGITFTFSNASLPSSNGTSVSRGQFPALIFS